MVNSRIIRAEVLFKDQQCLKIKARCSYFLGEQSLIVVLEALGSTCRSEFELLASFLQSKVHELGRKEIEGEEEEGCGASVMGGNGTGEHKEDVDSCWRRPLAPLTSQPRRIRRKISSVPADRFYRKSAGEALRAKQAHICMIGHAISTICPMIGHLFTLSFLSVPFPPLTSLGCLSLLSQRS